MPSASKKQHNFMAAIAHSPEFAKKAGVPQSVGKEFTAADKGRTFKEGGSMAKFEKSKADVESKRFGKEGSKKEEAFDKTQKFARGGGIEARGKTKGRMIAMKKGGKC